MQGQSGNYLHLVDSYSPDAIFLTYNEPIRWLKYCSFLFNDEQLIAFHNEVVKDKIVFPYQN